MSKIGGMQRVGIDLLEQLEMRDDVEVSTCLMRSSKQDDPLRFLPFMAKAWWTAQAKMKAGEIDAVLFSAMPSAALAAVLGNSSRKSGVALTAISHGHDVIAQNSLYQWLVGKVLQQLDAMFPVSHSTGEECVKRGLSAERLFVTPNGIDPDRFGASMPALTHKRAGRRKVLSTAFPELAGKVSADDLLLCNVGRQVKRKGHEWFIRNVMPKLPDSVHFAIGGTGPEAKAIQQAIADMKLQEQVHILGLVPEERLASLYAGGDVFVMPNIPVPGDMEGFGVVMLEAGLCGMPAIAAKLEGIQDVITEGISGFNIDPLDVEAYVAAISRLVSNPSMLEDLSKSSREHTLKTFSWHTIAEQIASKISNIADSKHPQN